MLSPLLFVTYASMYECCSKQALVSVSAISFATSVRLARGLARRSPRRLYSETAAALLTLAPAAHVACLCDVMSRSGSSPAIACRRRLLDLSVLPNERGRMTTVRLIRMVGDWSPELLTTSRRTGARGHADRSPEDRRSPGSRRQTPERADEGKEPYVNAMKGVLEFTPDVETVGR